MKRAKPELRQRTLATAYGAGRANPGEARTMHRDEAQWRRGFDRRERSCAEICPRDELSADGSETGLGESTFQGQSRVADAIATLRTIETVVAAHAKE